MSAAICHVSSKANSHQDHQDSVHPSVFVLVHLLWEQNTGFSRFTCNFQGRLGFRVVQVLLEINTVW